MAAALACALFVSGRPCAARSKRQKRKDEIQAEYQAKLKALAENFDAYEQHAEDKLREATSQVDQHKQKYKDSLEALNTHIAAGVPAPSSAHTGSVQLQGVVLSP